MTSQPNPLSAEELSHLSELREVIHTSETPGWQILITRMQRYAEDAREDLLGAAYGTDEALAGLTRRWQQREAMVRGLKHYIKECLDERDLLLKTDTGGVPDYAEDRTA